MSIRNVLLLMLLGTLACGGKTSNQRLNALPTAESDLFKRCTDGLHGHPAYTARGRKCNSYNALGNDFMPCWDKLKGEYTSLPNADARKKFLVDDGCPQNVVDATGNPG